ncbi:MAG: RdgB/HAM1 family non-canonical purine NTP pyrophosphatase [Oscillospiraceae bacterium]|nr:RdgB/HAM1 family non-canonical purine NTP pyrophosphatase [Oscillospiraceae bacterium]
MKIILASNNKGKLREMRELLADLGIEVLSQKEAGFNIEVEETGTTFEENSYLKASAITALSGLPAVADDSGLMVDALGGEPGVYSARYTGNPEDSDVDRYMYLLKKMEGVTDRRAKFVSAVCCTFPNGNVIRTRGECHGNILHAPVGEHGFGYDPIFGPECSEGSMAQLTDEEKNAISHRGKAVREFIEKLREYYADK